MSSSRFGLARFAPAGALLASLLGVAACTDTNSATNLNPDGPPMVQQVRMNEEFVDSSGTTNQRRVFGFGTHPMATAEEEHAVTTALATGQDLRIIIDELLVGNNLEEIQCRGVVDTDAFDSVPLGATPDDIAACSVTNDLLKASCKGDHAVCICHNDAGCGLVAKGEPVGVLDVNQDGAADNTSFKAGAVGIKCGTIDVPIDLDNSYWTPSGDQQVPAAGGFDALGPAIVLVPQGALPTNIACGLTFSADVVDKQGNQVCAPPNGDIHQNCTPGDVSAFTFTTVPLKVNGLGGLSDGDVGVSRVNDIFVTMSAPVDDTTLSNITITEAGNPFTAFTVALVPMKTDQFRISWTTPPLLANTVYAITFPTTLTDKFGQGLPMPVVITFTTGA